MLMENSSTVVEPSLYKPLLPVVDRKGSVMIRLRRRMASRRLWCILVKQGTVKRCVVVLLVLSVISIFCYTHYLVTTSFSR
ncbi:hypothetical protein Cfor_04122 [Coptotermes formosanus]|uniref:Uncharacterized protein n=1 Tax=Coptotermes formosanus TaxID=36987 RepID=A0A6L2PRR2_COPFO|nr:hypothetical protein Cfor_04122 [Coptotermes formosanus]